MEQWFLTVVETLFEIEQRKLERMIVAANSAAEGVDTSTSSIPEGVLPPSIVLPLDQREAQ